MSADYFRTLFEYNRWANHRVLDAAAQVPEDDYFAPAAGLSFGNLHATLVHALIAEIVWLARWNGELPPEGLKDARIADKLAQTEVPTFADVRRLYAQEEEKQQRFFAALTDDGAGRIVSYATQYGEPFTQPLDELMAHFINHGTQFRSEAAVRLTQLGYSPGDLDLIVFLRSR